MGVVNAVVNAVVTAVKVVVKTVVKIVSTVASAVSNVYHWVDKNITFGALGWIGRNTIGRVYQFGCWIKDKIDPPKTYKDLYPSGMDPDEIII